MMAFLESAEFWTSFAFVLVMILASSPVFKRLQKWGEKQAGLIIESEQEAEQLYHKAEALKNTYSQAYERRAQDRKKALQEVDQKIAFLEQEIQTKTQEKIHHKKLEVALRVKNIQENEQQILKTKLLERVVSQAQSTLSKATPAEKTDKLADSVCKALDQFKSVLN